MKLLPTLLTNLVIVTLGLFVYDSLREREPAPEGLLPSGPSGKAPSLGTEAGLQQRLRHTEGRLAALEVANERLRLALPRGGKVDPGAIRELLPPSEDEFDGRALDALRGYLGEIKRRDLLAHEFQLGERALARLDLGLNEDERTTVLKAYLSFRTRSKTFWQDLTKRGITDRKEQLAELKKLRASFAEEIRGTVADGDMERIVTGLLGGGTDPGQGAGDSSAARPPR